MARLRILFMGTPRFAVPVLDALSAAGHDLPCVYCRPPRPAGRGRKLRPSPVQEAAEALGLAVRTPQDLHLESEQRAFAAYQADAAVVAAYGLILPKPMLAAPRLGCLNLHASLLPRWRGAAPVERALMAGDEVTGVTVMRMDEGLDTGPILLQRRVPIDADDDAGTLRDKLSALGAALITEALDKLARGELSERPQPDEGITYAKSLTADDERLDWSASAAELARRVRALSPAPGAYFLCAGQRWKLLATELVPAADGAPGTVLDDRLTIACGTGALRPTRLQRPGRKAMAAAEALRGAAIPPGTVLG